MKLIVRQALWKYLFWLGPLLVTAGLTSGLIADSWDLLPLALIIAGVAIIGFWLIWQSQQSRWWGRRSTQAGTNALVATLAVVTILGLINFLGTRYSWRADLTETQLFTLAPQSRQLVRSLKEPVKVWVFDVNQDLQDRDLLENYRRYSSKFKFEYVDPQARPGLARKFNVKDFGEVYLETGERRQLVQVVGRQERLSEVKLTNRLQQIISAETLKVYFLQGHGEHQLSAGRNSISQAVQALSNRNYTTAPLNLTEKPQVPQDAAVVVAAGPQRPLFASEVNALREYLNRGGNLLLMINPNTDPKLDSLLAEWGVQLDNRIVVDVSGSVGLGPAAPIITEYGQHPITQDFGNGISVYPFSRPIETKPVTGVEVTPVLRTKPYPSSWAESDQESENLEFNPDSDRPGPLTLGVALKKKVSTPNASAKPKASPTLEAEARMVVLGNSEFATDGLFTQQLNGDVFLNSVTWLSQQDQQPLSISPKEAKNRRLNLTTEQANLLGFSSLLFLPLIGFAVAAILWWIRR